jgi:hypothetical protein
LWGQLTGSQDAATGGLFTLNHHDVHHLHRAAVAKKEAAAQFKEAKKLQPRNESSKRINLNVRHKRSRGMQTWQRKSDWTLTGRRLPIMDGKINFRLSWSPMLYPLQVHTWANTTAQCQQYAFTIKGEGGSSCCENELPRRDIYL